VTMYHQPPQVPVGAEGLRGNFRTFHSFFVGDVCT